MNPSLESLSASLQQRLDLEVSSSGQHLGQRVVVRNRQNLEVPIVVERGVPRPVSKGLVDCTPCDGPCQDEAPNARDCNERRCGGGVLEEAAEAAHLRRRRERRFVHDFVAADERDGLFGGAGEACYLKIHFFFFFVPEDSGWIGWGRGMLGDDIRGLKENTRTLNHGFSRHILTST